MLDLKRPINLPQKMAELVSVMWCVAVEVVIEVTANVISIAAPASNLVGPPAERIQVVIAAIVAATAVESDVDKLSGNLNGRKIAAHVMNAQ